MGVSFFLNPVNRRSRRVMPRGQGAGIPVGATAVLTSTGTTNVTITFSQPVVVTGTLGMTVATLTLVSQTVVSPTVVTQVWNGNVATHLGTLPANDPNVATYQGGKVAGTSVTF